MYFSKWFVRNLLLITAAFFLITTISEATEKEPASPIGVLNSEMNGIKLSDYWGFEDKWKLITVRFRTDTDEMRFEYANPLAWETLSNNRHDFPDGSVIGKIAVKTVEDPDFISSQVPAGARRYQVMVRDQKKYSATGGWGYALFTAPQKLRTTSSLEDSQTTDACYACHQVVEKKNYIFGVPLNLKFLVGAATANAITKNSYPKGLDFVDQGSSKLPQDIQSFLPLETKRVRLLKGAVADRSFEGTLDEMKPLLTEEAKRSGFPSLVMSEDGKRFTLVVPTSSQSYPNGTACPKNQKIFSFISSVLIANANRYYCN